ncbi:hypothetical protein BCR32DRAFT_289834 [Anaeromyces robustus]|uniref:Mini-chromosome maintenance complex-binding protein n=1 Tax=Anaeromyces robustus TaxID=1754192 RepID=A0A1Y1XM22_9FUNG|nr:hypothetical protein BCR32DRAFT_289834 [Anaeromyces robustus]|eukprot:ORX86771.1 hypothetical protein BCR32DRAFT_289834 [Anaeromyces robustus]
MTIENFISNPLNEIEKLIGNLSVNDINSFKEPNISEIFKNKFSNINDIKKIPLLNKSTFNSINSGTLVRYQCMIQDNGIDSELYSLFHLVKDKKTNEKKVKFFKYQDQINENDYEYLESEKVQTFRDRQLVYCINIPGHNSWAKEKSTVQSLDNKNYKIINEKFPIESEDNFGAIVKIYDLEDANDLKLNAVFEFIGILEYSEHNPTIEQSYDDLDMNLLSSYPLPHVHAIYWNKIENNSNPIINNIKNQLVNDQDIKNMRNEIVEYISNRFGGDELIAEYLLYNLVSRIYSRIDSLPVGKFSLNICNIKSTEQATEIYKLIQNIVSKSHYLTLEHKKLNNKRLAPSMNCIESIEQGIGLVSGELQLSDGTVLVVDETTMQEGKIDNTGVVNISILSDLFQNQKITYDFNYHTLDFPADINLIVLSEAKSKLFPCDCIIPLQNSANINQDTSVNEDLLNKIRGFIDIMKVSDYKIDQEMANNISKEFVEKRAEQSKGKQDYSKKILGQDDLLYQLNLARLYTLSHGQTQLTDEFWTNTKEFEEKREKRLNDYLRYKSKNNINSTQQPLR